MLIKAVQNYPFLMLYQLESFWNFFGGSFTGKLWESSKKIQAFRMCHHLPGVQKHWLIPLTVSGQLGLMVLQEFLRPFFAPVFQQKKSKKIQKTSIFSEIFDTLKACRRLDKLFGCVGWNSWREMGFSQLGRLFGVSFFESSGTKVFKVNCIIFCRTCVTWRVLECHVFSQKLYRKTCGAEMCFFRRKGCVSTIGGSLAKNVITFKLTV